MKLDTALIPSVCLYGGARAAAAPVFRNRWEFVAPRVRQAFALAGFAKGFFGQILYPPDPIPTVARNARVVSWAPFIFYNHECIINFACVDCISEITFY